MSVPAFSPALASSVLSLLLWVSYQPLLRFAVIFRCEFSESRPQILLQTIDLSMPALFTQLSEIYQIALGSTTPVCTQTIVREPNQRPGIKQDGICCSIQKIISSLCKPMGNVVYVKAALLSKYYTFLIIQLIKTPWFFHSSIFFHLVNI